MKEFVLPKATDLVRIQFGTRHSMSFEHATVEEVMDVVKKVFSEVRLNKTIKLKDWCPMQAPQTEMNLIIYVRKEMGNRSAHEKYRPGGSKNKTIYGLTGQEAMEIFKNNYQKFL